MGVLKLNKYYNSYFLDRFWNTRTIFGSNFYQKICQKKYSAKSVAIFSVSNSSMRDGLLGKGIYHSQYFLLCIEGYTQQTIYCKGRKRLNPVTLNTLQYLCLMTQRHWKRKEILPKALQFKAQKHDKNTCSPNMIDKGMSLAQCALAAPG